jgi:ABC-type uncharacterized transport system auxiliary subunit
MNRRIPGMALPAILLPIMLLAGCGGLLTSEQPARQNYLLRPYESVAAADSVPKPELVLDVGVVPGLDTDRLQALGVDARLNYYANARWPDHLPEVLTSVLQRSLEFTGRFAGVGASADDAPAAWRLDLEVREFYGIQNSAGLTTSVRVGLAGRLTCGDQVHALRLTESAPVAEERLAVVVAAHQAALDQVTRQLIDTVQLLCAAAVDLRT